MHPPIPQHLPNQLRGPIHDQMLLGELVSTVHKPNQLHHFLELIKVTQLRLHGRKQAQRNVRCRLGCFLCPQVLPDLSLLRPSSRNLLHLSGDELSAWWGGKMPGQKEQVPTPSHRDVAVTHRGD
eukprot:TRINITY_DN670_c0_g1_i3.p1 TRINITY_DN670_c0_g1~~TRINITY_DN670_c0_g1_i3.p1  ORF type:complete len:125 (-),score=9.73 TRINITY_DN670_c0_g1_i3:50-424(-)